MNLPGWVQAFYAKDTVAFVSENRLDGLRLNQDVQLFTGNLVAVRRAIVKNEIRSFKAFKTLRSFFDNTVASREKPERSRFIVDEKVGMLRVRENEGLQFLSLRFVWSPDGF